MSIKNNIIIPVKKLLCWILIFNHGLLSVAQAFERTIQFQVDQSPQGGMALSIIRHESEHLPPETLVKTPLTSNIHHSHTGLSISYAKASTGHAQDRWLINYGDTKGNTNLSFYISEKGSIQIHKLDLKDQKIEISALGLIRLKSNTINAASLTLSGASICNESRLNISKELSLSASHGNIINSPGGQFIVNGAFHVLKGDLENQGRIASSYHQLEGEKSIPTRSLLINMHGNKLTNNLITTSRIEGDGGLAIINALEIINKAKIKSHGMMVIEAGHLLNHKKISSAGTLALTGGTLKNNHLIKAQNIESSLHHFINNKVIAVTEKLTANESKLSNQGGIKAKDVITRLTHIDNQGDFVVDHILLLNGGSLTNGRMIKAQKIHGFFLEKIINSGTIHSLEELTVQHFLEWTNSKTGKVSSEGAFSLLSQKGVVHNEGQMKWQGHATLFIKKFANKVKGTVKGTAGTWATSKFENEHKIVMDKSFHLLTSRGYNTGSIKTGDQLKLVTRRHFRNKGRLSANDQIIVKGWGILTNDTEGKILTPGELYFRKLLKVRNKGHIQSQTALTLERIQTFINTGETKSDHRLTLQDVVQVDNHGLIQGESGDWNVTTLINEKTIHFADTFLLTGLLLKNKGILQANHSLTFQALRVLKNKLGGKIYTQCSLDMVCPEAWLINRGDVSFQSGSWSLNTLINHQEITARNGSLALQSKSVENHGSLQANENLFFESQENLINKNHIQAAGNLLVKNVGQIINEQEFMAQDTVEFHQVGELHNAGEIKGKQLSFHGVERADNLGTIHGQEGKWDIDFLSNYRAINFNHSFQLMGIQLRNAGILQANHALTFQNFGSLKNKSGGTIHTQGSLDMVCPDAWFRNEGDVSLQSGTWTLDTLINHDEITASKGALVLRSKRFENHRSLKTGDDLLFEGQETLVNKRKIKAGGNITINATGQIVNDHEIASSKTVKIHQAQNLQNKGAIKGERLSLHLVREIENLGHLKGKKGVTLQQFTTLHNRSVGSIVSNGALVLQSPESGGVTNEGVILGKRGKWGIKSLSNHQDITIQDHFTLTVFLMENQGRVQALGDLTLECQEKLMNKKHIEANGNITINATGQIVNDHEIASSKTVKIHQAQNLQNKGAIKGERLSLHLVREIENLGSLKGKKEVTLHQFATLFNRPAGSIISNEALVFQSPGLGRVTNEGVFLGKKGDWNLASLSNHKDITLQEELYLVSLGIDNHGYFRTGGNLTLETKAKLDNRKKIEAGGTLLIKNSEQVSNESEISSSNAIEVRHVKELENKGEIKGNHITLGRVEKIENKGLFFGNESLTFQDFLSLTNTHPGSIHSKGQMTFTSLQSGTVTNKGKLHGRKGEWAVKSLFNHHETAMDEAFHLTVVSLQNHGQLIGLNEVCLSIQELFENKGQLSGGKKLVLKGPGKVINKPVSGQANSGQMTADMAMITHLQSLASEGGILGKEYLLLADIKTLTNGVKGIIASEKSLNLEHLGDVSNHGTFQGNSVKMEVRTLSNHQDILALQTLLLKASGTFENKEKFISQGSTTLTLGKEAHNHGQIVSNNLLLHGSKLINHKNIQTKGNLSGDLSKSLSQNKGSWVHEGPLVLDSTPLVITGTVDIVGDLTCLSGLPGKSFRIENRGELTLKKLQQAILHPIELINYHTLTLQDIIKITFSSLVNKKLLNLEGNWQIQPSSKGGVEMGKLGKLTTPGNENQSFKNEDTVNVYGDLSFHFPVKMLGNTKILGDLTTPVPLKSLQDLVLRYPLRKLSLTLNQEYHLSKDLDLSAIKIIELKVSKPLTIAARLITHQLKIISSAPVIIGTDLSSFGQVQAKGGDLEIHAPTILGKFAKLFARGKLHLQGKVTLGGYVEKSPNERQYLGAWKGNPVNDLFEETRNPNYRASNGTLLYGETIHIEGAQLSISYCSLYSNILTFFSTTHPLHFLTVDFFGNGGLSISSPKLTFSGERTRKGAIKGFKEVDRRRHVSRSKKGPIEPSILNIYDYLLSTPTAITHMGDVSLTMRDGVNFVGTKIQARSLLVNGSPRSNTLNSGKVNFYPIYLGQVEMDRLYGMHIEKKTNTVILFTFLGLMLAGQAIPETRLESIVYHKRDLKPHFTPFSPPLNDTSTAEINCLGLCMDDIKQGRIQRTNLESMMREAHDNGGVYVDGSILQTRTALQGDYRVHTIAPDLLLGRRFQVDAASLMGLLGVDVRNMSIQTQNDISLRNPTVRKIPQPAAPVLVNLASLPIIHKLAAFQHVGNFLLPGFAVPQYGDIPWLVQGGKARGDSFYQLWRQGVWAPPVKPQLNVPIDLVLQSALAQTGRIYYAGISGRDLVQKCLKDSKSLAYLMPVIAQVKDLQELKKLLLVYLVHYDQAANKYGLPQLTAHIPSEAQNPRHGPGVQTFEKGKLNSQKNIHYENYEINVGREFKTSSKNFKAESTAHTSVNGPITTQTIISPMIINAQAGGGANIVAKTEESFELKGTQVYGGPQGSFEIMGGKAINLTAPQMTKTTRQKHGYIKQGSHLATAVDGFGSHRQEADQLYQQGPRIFNGKNKFKGKTLKAEPVIDYQETLKKNTKHGAFGKSKSSTYTKMATGVSQPSYQGKTDLNVDHAVFLGAHFNGEVLDRTKTLELLPAVSLYIKKIKKNSSWLGTTKGCEGSQGEEQVYPTEIHGKFVSKRHKDALPHENVLRLTSTILDLYDSQIEKQVIKSEYVPKKWSKFKQTGNFKAVALTVSAIVSVASMGWGAVLMGFIQNAALNAMATAAFSNVCTQAASSLVVNQGNVKKVGKDLMKSDALKDLAISTITAGVTKGCLLAEKGIVAQSAAYQQLPDLAKRFTRDMATAAVSLHVDYAIKGGSYMKKLQGHVVNGLVATTSGYLSSKVGAWYQESQVNALSNKLVDGVLHKLMHGAIGGLSSYALKEDVTAGAIGSMAAESVAELFYHAEKQNLQSQQEQLDEKIQKGEISPHAAKIQQADLDKRSDSLKDSCIDMGKYAAIAAATIARVDPYVALRTATTALENDFVQDSPLLLYMLQRQTEASNKPLSKYQLSLNIRLALEKAGHTFEQITLLMNDPGWDRLLTEVTNPEQQGIPKASRGIPTGQKLKIEIFPIIDPLDRALGICAQGAEFLTDFADRHPHLTNLTMTALQVAIAGPVGLARDKVMEAVGVHDTVDALANAGKEWFSRELQNRLNMPEAYANAYSEAGVFGIVFGVGMVGGASKDKVLRSAKETTEKVKSLTRIRSFPDGPSKTVPSGKTLPAGEKGKDVTDYRKNNDYNSFQASSKGNGVVRSKESEIPAGTISGEVPGRVQTRINARNGEGTKKSPGLKNAWRKHGEGAKDNKSQFTISKEEVKSILQDRKTIEAPVGIDPDSGAFVREVDVGKIIGKLPASAGSELTTKITILTDKYGNLINAFPGNYIY